jgi:hypothetical protein
VAAADAPATDTDENGEYAPPGPQPSDTAPAGGGPPTPAPVEEAPPPLKAKREAAKSEGKRPAYWDTDMSGSGTNPDANKDMTNVPAERPGYWDTNMSANDQPAAPAAAAPAAPSAAHVAAMGIGDAVDKLAIGGGKIAGGIAAIGDKIHSVFTATPQTGAQDWWFGHVVDPYVQRDAEQKLGPDASTTDKAIYGVSNMAATIASFFAGGPVAGEAEASSALAAHLMQAGASATVPAASEAIATGQDVLDATGNKTAAAKAAVMAYMSTTAGALGPAGVGKGALAKIMTGAAIGGGLTEAQRQAQNAVMPESMQQKFDPLNETLGVVTGAAMGGAVHLTGPRGVVDAGPGNAMEHAQRDAAAAVARAGGDDLSQVVAATQVNAHVGAVHDAAAVQGAREAEAAHQDAALQAHQQAELEQQQAENEGMPPQAEPEAAPPAEGAQAGALPPEQQTVLDRIKAQRTAPAAEAEPEQTVQERMKANAKGTEDEFEELPAEEAAKAPETAQEEPEEEEAPETNPRPQTAQTLAERRQQALDEAMAEKVRGNRSETTTPETNPNEAPAEKAVAAMAAEGRAPGTQQRTAEALGNLLGRAGKRMALEAHGQDILDTLQENGTKVNAVANKFWNDTYYKLPADVQGRFRRMLASHAGLNSAADMDVPITVRDRMDLPDNPEHLEGTDRGFVALMDEANRRSEETPAPATPEEPIAAPEPPNRLAAIRAAAEKRRGRPPLQQGGEDTAEPLFQEQARQDMEAARAKEAQYQAVNPETGEKTADLADFAAARAHKEAHPEDDIQPAQKGALSAKREENGWFNDQGVAKDLDRAMNPRMGHDEAKEHLAGVSDATAPRSFMIHASQDADTIPKHLADQITAVKADGLRVKGAYEDGVAHIFADSHKAGDKEELLNTAVHELTHQGLHSFLGDDYTKTLTGIAHDIKDTKWAKDYVQRRGYDLKNPTHMRLLGDEYAAHLAENQFAGREVHADLPVLDRNPSHWQRITDAVRGGLRKLGLVKHWNDNDVAKLIRQAQAHVSGAEPLKAARDGAAYKASGGARFSLENADENMEDHYAPDHPLAVGHKFGRTMEEQANYNPGWVRSAKDTMSDFRDNAPRKVLGGIGLRNLPDFLPPEKMPNLHAFIDAHDAMEGRKGQMHTRDAALGKEWSQWNAKQDDRGAALSDLMHASTLSGHDPSKPYVERYTAAERAADPAAAKDERYQREIHRSLQRQFNEKLDSKGQELYNRVRDNYAEKRSQVYDALKARIAQTDADGETKKNLMAELRKSFESNTVKGPYFPLQRFGNLWANAKDENGNTKAFARFESGAQQKAWRAEMEKQGLVTDGGKRMDTNSMMERIDPDFVRNVMGLAHDADPSGNLEKDIWEQYLRAMPEMSMRKHMITRVGRLGFSQDAQRAFAFNSFHGAHQLARLEYGHQLESKLAGAEQDARALEQKAGQNPDDKQAQSDARWAPELAHELKDRYEWIKNPRASRLASGLTKFGFNWYLGAAPATAFRIFSQNPMLAAPMLAKHFNWLGATKELSRATGQWAKSYGSLGDTLRGDERRAHDEASDMGVFSNNNTQMLASGGEGGPIGHGPYAAFTKAAGFLFNAMENHNRMTTHLAAYRLGRQADMGHADAAKLARQITWDSHFDYTNANRPRYLQNDTAKVIGLFKQYSLGVTYRLAREFRDMTASDQDPESRKAAAVAFGALIGRMMMFAGVTGMPLYWVAEKVVNTVMGSQDQPYDMTAALHKHLNDALGETAGDMIMTGPVGAISGASLSGGASYNDLWYRPPSREESTSEQMLDGLGQLAGPIAAIPTNAAAGIDMMRTGNVERGLEHMLPPEAAALAKSVRYATQGANNMSGEPVVPKDQITNRDLFLQSVGFTPQKMADAYARNSAIKNIDKDITDRHNLLANQYETAMLNNDQKEMDSLQPKIDAFNKANPGMAIGKGLSHGAMTKARAQATAQAGVNVAKGNEHLEQEY